MRPELIGSNCVITTSVFNPSILSQLWLVKHGILREADSTQGCMFSDAVVQVQTVDFALLVLPQQIQFVPKQRADAHDLVNAHVRRILTALPETPYTAVGLNFTWHIDPAPEPLESVTRKMFFNKSSKLCAAFDADDANFGMYLSKNVNNARLKLDIKPVVTLQPGQPLTQPSSARDTRLQLLFNFHKDADPVNRASSIIDILQSWRSFDEQAEELTQVFLQGSL